MIFPLHSLKKMKATPGEHEAKFRIEIAKDDDANCLATCQLYDADDATFKQLRSDIIDALDKFLVSRFVKTLEDPILDAAKAFSHRHWPTSQAALQGMHNDAIKLLYSHYGHFFEADETEADVLEQWEAMKIEIGTSEGLMSLSFHELWARMLIQFSDQYALVLRLVVITLLIPVDTSECERIFSLMNDIKTPERSSMGQQNLKNLMLWHALAVKQVDGKFKPMDCKDVPVMEILKEFRAMAGPKGRKAHRAAPKVSYEYEKHCDR
jgi:hypothetical protein